MVIVDTTVWIEYLRGADNPHTLWLEQRLQKERLALLDIILCEVLQGIREDHVFAQVREDLLTFHIFSSGGTNLAIAAAQNYRLLRARGRTVRKTIDCWIATFCLQDGHQLLHRDRDFDLFEQALGLQVVHP